MKTKTKPYFLTLDERRRLKEQNITRPGRYVERQYGAKKVIKEKSQVLSARIAKSSYARFKNSIGPDQPIGEVVESALLTYLAFRACRSEEVILACTEDSILKHRKEIAKLKHKRRKGRIGPKSKAYDFAATDFSRYWIITVPLPPVRSVEKRIEQLIGLFRMADVYVHFE